MRFLQICVAFAALALALPLGAMSQKSDIMVRFHTETNPNDGEAFAIPVNLTNQRRQAYLCRVPDFSEKQVDRIFPFQARDGSWGCVFKLNPQGRIRLETISGEIHGGALVVFVMTKAGRRQVSDMVIDRTVSDGIITVPRGLTEFEVLALRKNFKVVGEQPKKGFMEPKQPRKEDLPGSARSTKPSLLEPLSTSGTSRRRTSTTEPPLPRLSD